MKPYTVLLKRPEYMTDGHTETVQWHVMANSAALAGRAGKVCAVQADYAEDAGDYVILAIYSGHIEDLSPF